MNDTQHAVYSAYLRLLADQMGLRDWEITLAPEQDSDPEAAASCSTTYGRKYATIRFGAGFFEDTPEEQRYYCVHELLHCHLYPIHLALASAQGRLGSDAYGVLESGHHDAMEWAIDGIGVAYAKFLPLPPVTDDEELPANVIRFTPEQAA